MRINDITDRQRALLFVLVEEHIATGLAVSSEHLLKRGGFSCSSATIRNDLVKLESDGYVDKPHSSSGRLPTEAAFKLYAAYVVDGANLNENEKSQISGALGDIRLGILDVLNRASEFLSDETKMVSLVTTTQSHGTVSSIDLVPIGPESLVIILVTSDAHVENEKINLAVDLEKLNLDSLKTRLNVLLTGKKLNEINREFLDTAFESALITNIYHESIKKPIIEFFSRLINQQGPVVFSHGLRTLIENPQFSESIRLRAFLKARNEEEFVNQILTDLSDDRSKVRVLIGRDNPHEDMHKLSLVFTNFTLAESGQEGQLGVLGPTRMPYAKIIPLVDYIAEYLSEKLGGRILLR